MPLPNYPPKNGEGFINPYNFVRLGKPEGRKSAPASQEKFSGLSGRLTCSIKLLAPICIPDAEESEEVRVPGSDNEEDKRWIKRFSKVDGKPYISGSSIKGVVRSAAEAVSSSCLSVLDDYLYIFRDNRDHATRNKKIGKMSGSMHNKKLLAKKLDAPPQHLQRNANHRFFPRRGLLNQINRDYSLRYANSRDWQGVQSEDIPQEVAELYEEMISDARFTLENKDGHWRDRHNWDETNAKKWLKDYNYTAFPTTSSEYWWFRKSQVNGKNDVIQIGRNFRFKWAYRILDAIPKEFYPCTRPDMLCPACRLFGMVAGEDEEKSDNAVNAVAGRVYVGPAKWVSAESPQIEMVEALSILNSPKASCRSFYLEPDDPNEFSVGNDEFLRRLNGKLVTAPARGRKFYWHHLVNWDGNDLDYLKMKEWPENSGSRPKNKLNADVEVLMPDNEYQFEFIVDFENLELEELGLLMWSLELPENENMAHHIGLGKPLGLGSVKIKISDLALINRKRRYEELWEFGRFSKNEWLPENNEIDGPLDQFRKRIASQNGVSKFDEAPAVADLLVMLDIHQPKPAKSRDVEICYPPGIMTSQRDEGEQDVHFSQIHHTWFGPRGFGWGQRLLRVDEIAEGKRQLKVGGG